MTGAPVPNVAPRASSGTTMAQETQTLSAHGTRRGHSKMPPALRSVRLWLFAIPALLALLIYQWEPLLATIVESFYSFKGLSPASFIGLQNYRRMFANPAFGQTFINTVEYVGWSLAIGFLVPVIMAIAISEIPRGRGIFRACVYLPALVPSVVTSLMWEDVFSAQKSGLANQLLSRIGLPTSSFLLDPHLATLLIVVTLTWNGFGATTILYLAGLSGVDRGLYEAAVVDGAGFWRRTWHVTLPQLRGLMELFFILQIIGVFQVFIQPLIMTNGGPNHASESLVLLNYITAFRYFEPGQADVVGVFTFVALLGVTVFYLRSNAGRS